MNDLAKSVKNVMTVFLVFFIALISYIAYFQLIKSPKINDMPGNTRVIAVKNEVLRGTIYDRDGNPLTTSERVNETSQKRNYLYDDLYVHALGYTSAVYGTTGLEEEYESELTTYNAIGNNFRQFLDSIDVKGLIENIKNDKENTGSFNFSSNFKAFMDGIKFDELTKEADKVGNGVVTTLDTTLQQVASDALGDNKGAVVALNPKTGEIMVIPSREDSYERLLEAEKQFVSDTESVEELVMRGIILERLDYAMKKLAKEELAIIYALFYQEISELELAKQLGIPRTTLQSRKYKILEKLKKLL